MGPEVIPVGLTALPVHRRGQMLGLEGREGEQAPALVVLLCLIIQTLGRDFPVLRAMQLRVVAVVGVAVEK